MMVSEELVERILNKTKTVVPNIVPMNDTRFTLVEVLIECDSDRDRNRYFRKLDSNNYIASSREHSTIMGDLPFGVILNVDGHDFLDYEWYEVTSLHV